MVANALRTHYVYALCEPDGKTVRYIGCTKQPWKRLCGHVGKPTRGRLRHWVYSLRRRGLAPVMVILFEVNGREAGLALEAETIQNFRRELGDSLLNQVNVTPRVVLYTGKIEYRGVSRRVGAWASILQVPRRVLVERLKTGTPETVFPSIRADIADEARSIREFRSEFAKAIKPVESPLSHDARRERRKEMAAAVAAGESKQIVAERFGVTLVTVSNAVRQFSVSY
jgi:hypothetical protein